jgi:hypothetical protein
VLPLVDDHQQALVESRRLRPGVVPDGVAPLLWGTIVAGVVPSVVGLPFPLNLGGAAYSPHEVSTIVLGSLVAVVTGAITSPFVSAVPALVHLDRRIELERLDLVLAQEAAVQRFSCRRRGRARSCPPSRVCRRRARSAGARSPSGWPPVVRGA